VRAEPRLEPFEVVEHVDVVDKVRNLDEPRRRERQEALGASAAVDRLEQTRRLQRKRIRRPVRSSHDGNAARRDRPEQGQQVARRRGGHVGVDHEHRGLVHRRQRLFHRGALTLATDHEGLPYLARGCGDIGEHCLGDDAAQLFGQALLRIANPERDHDRGHVKDTTEVAAPGNAALADRLDSFAALLELADAQYHAVRAYRRAAEVIRSTPAPVAELVRAGRARELRGIGPGIEARLRELVETGDIQELVELEHELAPELIGLGRLLGIGAKRGVEIGRALGVSTLDDFRAAADAGRLQEVPGIGPQTERKLLEALRASARPRPPRGLLINRAWALSEAVADAFGAEVAGDPRRFKDSSERLAVVACADGPKPLLDEFERLPQIVAVLERREDRATGVTVEGIPVELVVAPRTQFGTELLRATGSEAYVTALEPLPAGRDEQAVYATLGIPYLPPELREQPFRGEPPTLVEIGDVRGDLHCHTTWSDGRESVFDMGAAARELGYEYLAICDHTPAVGAVAGLNAGDVRRQREEIAAANERLAPFRILAGIECDILAGGELDLPDDVLAELDWVQASVHGGQRQSREQLTKRSVAALENPYVSALSHPTGRYIGRRPPNAVDLEAVIAAAKEHGKGLETNGLSDRLDLRDEHVRLAVEAGVPIVCSTDAHSIRGLGNMRNAVATARRGWATAADVLNTRPLGEILALRRGT
jgi:DNA polymerase (family X)